MRQLEKSGGDPALGGVQGARKRDLVLGGGPGGGVGVVGDQAGHLGAAKPVELEKNCMDHFTNCSTRLTVLPQ